jgi:hypothetical protein
MATGKHHSSAAVAASLALAASFPVVHDSMGDGGGGYHAHSNAEGGFGSSQQMHFGGAAPSDSTAVRGIAGAVSSGLTSSLLRMAGVMQMAHQSGGGGAGSHAGARAQRERDQRGGARIAPSSNAAAALSSSHRPSTSDANYHNAHNLTRQDSLSSLTESAKFNTVSGAAAGLASSQAAFSSSYNSLSSMLHQSTSVASEADGGAAAARPSSAQRSARGVLTSSLARVPSPSPSHHVSNHNGYNTSGMASGGISMPPPVRKGLQRAHSLQDGAV